MTGWRVQQEATSSLKLPNVAGIFYILISGLCMSLLIAGIEFLHKSRTEARRRRVRTRPLHARYDHYILILWFLSSLSSFLA